MKESRTKELDTVHPSVKQITLKKGVQELFKKGTRYRGNYVTLVVLRGNSSTVPSQFLFAVSKKVRTKPVRNTIKRKMRVIIRELFSDVKNGYHFAIIAQKSNPLFQNLKEDILYVLHNSQVLCKSNLGV